MFEKEMDPVHQDALVERFKEQAFGRTPADGLHRQAVDVARDVEDGGGMVIAAHLRSEVQTAGADDIDDGEVDGVRMPAQTGQPLLGVGGFKGYETGAAQPKRDQSAYGRMVLYYQNAPCCAVQHNAPGFWFSRSNSNPDFRFEIAISHELGTNSQQTRTAYCR